MFPTPTAVVHVDVVPPAAPTAVPRALDFGGTCCPNQVVIALTTTLLIPDYARFYDTDIFDFQPSYRALDDGSLLTPPFIIDLYEDNVALLVTGLLAMLFARNLFVSADYIRRARMRVKRKDLFYVLFASQLLALVSFIPMIFSQFSLIPNCTFVSRITFLAGTVSLAMLITWILGFKAYKCLNNSRFILLTLILFFGSSSSVAMLEVVRTQARRRLTGGCTRTSDMRMFRIYILLQLGQTLFIFTCFLYAVWKSRGSPVARGRISLRISLDDVQTIPENPSSGQDSGRRGWWDYVPKKEPTTPVYQTSHSKSAFAFARSLYTRLRNPFRPLQEDDLQARPLRKPSVHGDVPLPQPRRSRAIKISESVSPVSPSEQRSPSRTSVSTSSLVRLSRYMPRMEVFRDVMKDELCYTAVIAASCVVVAVLLVIGLNLKNGLPVIGWLSLNWAITSLLAIHSFGRVIRRHERDAILQGPASFNTIGQINSSHSPEATRTRRQWPPRMSPSSLLRLETSNSDADPKNPFADSQRVRVSGTSWNSVPVEFPSPTKQRMSPTRSIIGGDVGLESLPSLYLADEFPTSGRTTPLVPHDSMQDASVIRDIDLSLRHSWVAEPLTSTVTPSPGLSTLVDTREPRSPL